MLYSIVSAIQWVIETKDVYNTKVLNLSLGTPVTDPISSDPLVRACDEAAKAGITVVVAAGNSGPSKKTILSPGNSPKVITVGAVDDNKTPELDDDAIAPFSSRGPTKSGYKKPDLVAPGVDIMSLSNSKLDDYVSQSGTSMATPFVAGTIALLHSKRNNLTPAMIKSNLMDNCLSLNDNYNNQGSGIISLDKLFNSQIKEASPQQHPTTTNVFGESFIIIILVILLLTERF
ncbi:S8 family serine peptidase [Sporosalibacterium faouarense]|uniref:S8 family serine peptidase n=1 Tax=Sporosalibacterium faouarense TaxID=516123 RepID=UPI00192B9D33